MRNTDRMSTVTTLAAVVTTPPMPSPRSDPMRWARSRSSVPTMGGTCRAASSAWMAATPSWRRPTSAVICGANATRRSTRSPRPTSIATAHTMSAAELRVLPRARRRSTAGASTADTSTDSTMVAVTTQSWRAASASTTRSATMTSTRQPRAAMSTSQGGTNGVPPTGPRPRAAEPPPGLTSPDRSGVSGSVVIPASHPRAGADGWSPIGTHPHTVRGSDRRASGDRPEGRVSGRRRVRVWPRRPWGTRPRPACGSGRASRGSASGSRR